MTYSLPMFGTMQADEVRMDGYRAALEALIDPGCRVLDIGAGPGIMTLLACRLGAGAVDAVDIDDSIHVARQLAAANGYSDRVRCRQALSTDIELSRPADVIVADLRGVLPLYGGNIPSLVDARTRLLAAGGTLVPRCDWLMGAIASARGPYDALVGPWEQRPLDLRLDAGRYLVVQHWFRVQLSADDVMSDVQTIAELDYTSITSPNVSASASWTIARPGTVHGLVLWFRTELCAGVGYETAPAMAATGYGQALFPFERPVEVRAGTRAEIALTATLIDGDYVWTWNTRIAGDEGEIAHFDQTTFAAMPLSRAITQVRSADSQPSLNAAGTLDRLLLSLMDGRRSLTDIARLASERDSGVSTATALRRAADLAERYRPAGEAPRTE